jgi:hypothetical protein
MLFRVRVAEIAVFQDRERTAAAVRDWLALKFARRRLAPLARPS